MEKGKGMGKEFFHITKAKKVPSILERGLVEGEAEPAGVYLTGLPYPEALEWADFLGEGGEEMGVVGVKLPKGTKLRIDPQEPPEEGLEKVYYTTGPIPPSQLRLVEIVPSIEDLDIVGVFQAVDSGYYTPREIGMSVGLSSRRVEKILRILVRRKFLQRSECGTSRVYTLGERADLFPY